MTLPRTVADVLSDHVTFEVECIDRMYLNVWVPRLAYGGGVAGFFVGHRGNRYASTALMDRIHSGESLIAWVDRCGHAVAGMLQGLSRKASRSAVKTGTSCARAVAM
jgi:hypothetical protein